MQSSLDRGLQKLSTSLSASLPAAVASSLGPSTAEAFKEAFASTLLPGYERASQKMFDDLHGAFQRGLDQFQQPLAAVVAEQRHEVMAANAQLRQAAADSAAQVPQP